MSVRTTIRLLDEESTRVREYAREHGASENYVIRLAVRLLVGLPTGAPAPERLSHVTGEDQ